ncbi:META domain-containing protein [Vibrio sp. Isolate34]|uniref:META domain-containing protein n=1 Tax=Vibrio sp. Isolate34 TaxID=2908540 RepID=UPI001EFDB433|nr:META domain-containing protein [Vibrio sp. Isolate34]MCG9639705.1 META domain-containing protein [Vibrio sp. Isolate34]
MKFSSKKLLAVAALPMMLAACTTTGDNAMKVTPTDLQHHNWELAQIDGKDIEKSENQATPRLEIGEKMTANGIAGCNNFFGQGELKDGQFRIKQMGMTMKMCQGSAMEIEQSVSATLSEWSDVTLTNDTLVLKNDVHTLTYTIRDWVN